MSFGSTPLSTTTLGANQFPVSAVQEPGQTNLTALEGGPGSVDANSNRTAPANVAIKVGAALTPWSSQPTITVTAAADTVLKWGSGGTTPFTHLSGQNNGSINFVYSIDADSTVSGAKVYVVAPGQPFFLDRAGSVLHCHTASSVSFGGDTGITVEAFA